MIRKALPQEAEALTQLAWRSKTLWDYDQKYLEESRRVIRISKEDIENWPALVLEESGTPRGFCALKLVSEEKRLHHLWVEPHQVRKGAGRQLFEAALQAARNLGWSNLRIVADPPAEGFYKKMGAQTIGHLKSPVMPDLLFPHMEIKLS